MKQIFIALAFMLTFQAYGQKKIVWFDTGVKVQYGGAGFYNAAVASNNTYNYKIGSGLSYGGKLGINFNSGGLAIDVMRNSAHQIFDKPNLDIKWSSWDLYTLYRNSANLGYFEIGPKVSLLDKVTRIEEGISADLDLSNFNKTVFSGVVGFGANLMGNDGRFSGILGLRFEYAFTDMVNQDNGQTLGIPVINPSLYADGYKTTNIAFAGIVFELNWGIGYFGKARCGARSKFIMF